MQDGEEENRNEVSMPNWLEGNHTLRWILVPVSFIAIVLLAEIVTSIIIIVFGLFVSFIAAGHPAAEPSLIAEYVIVYLIKPGAIGFFIVWIPSVIAPAKKFIVAMITSVITLVLSGGSITYYIGTQSWWDLIQTVASIIGVGIALFTIHSDREPIQ